VASKAGGEGGISRTDMDRAADADRTERDHPRLLPASANQSLMVFSNVRAFGTIMTFGAGADPRPKRGSLA